VVSLSVKDLKALLSGANVDISKCLEKSDLVELAVKHKLLPTTAPPPIPSKQPAPTPTNSASNPTPLEVPSSEASASTAQRRPSRRAEAEIATENPGAVGDLKNKFEKGPVDDSTYKVGRKFEFKNVDIKGLQNNVNLGGLKKGDT